MKALWKLTKEAARYKGLYVIAILSTFGLTMVNLIAPKILSAMTGLVEKGMDDTALSSVIRLEELMEKKGIYYHMQKAQVA